MIVVSYGVYSEDELETHVARVVHVDERNECCASTAILPPFPLRGPDEHRTAHRAVRR